MSILRRLDVDIHLETLSDEDFYVPKGDCPLMTHDGMTYLDLLEKEKVPRVPAKKGKEFPYDLDGVPYNASQLCVYLFSRYVDKVPIRNFKNVHDYFGFDAQHPPDIKYLLLLLQTQVDAKDPFLQALPQLQTSDMTTKQLKSGLKMLVRKVALKASTINFPKLLNDKIKTEASTYMFLKFKAPEFKLRYDEIKEQAATNASIAHMLNDLPVPTIQAQAPAPAPVNPTINIT